MPEIEKPDVCDRVTTFVTALLAEGESQPALVDALMAVATSIESAHRGPAYAAALLRVAAGQLEAISAALSGSIN